MHQRKSANCQKGVVQEQEWLKTQTKGKKRKFQRVIEAPKRGKKLVSWGPLPSVLKKCVLKKGGGKSTSIRNEKLPILK